MKQNESGQIEESGKSDCQWEEFLRYATDRLKTPATVKGLALLRMEEAQGEEVLETARRDRRV